MKNTRRGFLLTAISAPVAAAVAVTAPGVVPSRSAVVANAGIVADFEEYARAISIKFECSILPGLRLDGPFSRVKANDEPWWLGVGNGPSRGLSAPLNVSPQRPIQQRLV